MTEEIIKEIKEAEEKASALKIEAQKKAEEIVREAEGNATQKELSSVEVCKAYANSQMKNAQTEADNAYADALASAQAEAKTYAKDILKNADVFVSEIVRRVLSGDC